MSLAPVIEIPFVAVDLRRRKITREVDMARKLRAGEVRLLAVLATGAPVAVVAGRLGFSERTVRRHIRNLCDELGVGTPIEAVAWAARRQLI